MPKCSRKWHSNKQLNRNILPEKKYAVSLDLTICQKTNQLVENQLTVKDLQCPTGVVKETFVEI